MPVETTEQEDIALQIVNDEGDDRVIDAEGNLSEGTKVVNKDFNSKEFRDDIYDNLTEARKGSRVLELDLSRVDRKDPTVQATVEEIQTQALDLGVDLRLINYDAADLQEGESKILADKSNVEAFTTDQRNRQHATEMAA